MGNCNSNLADCACMVRMKGGKCNKCGFETDPTTTSALQHCCISKLYIDKAMGYYFHCNNCHYIPSNWPSSYSRCEKCYSTDVKDIRTKK